MAQVEESLREESRLNPERIPYCIHIDPKRPGSFVLSWFQVASKSFRNQIVEVSPQVLFSCLLFELFFSWIFVLLGLCQ